MNKSTRTDLIRSNFQHISLFLFKLICRYHKPRQIKFTSPRAFYNLLHTLEQSFSISSHPLAQPDIFTLRQYYSLFPSVFFYLVPVNCLPSCFTDPLKLSMNSLKWFSFSSLEYMESFHVSTTLKCYTVKFQFLNWLKNSMAWFHLVKLIQF